MQLFDRINSKLLNKRRKSQATSRLAQSSESSLVSPLASPSIKSHGNSAFELDVSEDKKPPLSRTRSKSTTTEETLTQFLQNHVLFKGLGETFLSIIAASMQVRIFNDMDFVIKKGQVGRAMFFVQRGTIEVISEDGIIIDCFILRRNRSQCHGSGIIFWRDRTHVFRSEDCFLSM